MSSWKSVEVAIRKHLKSIKPEGAIFEIGIPGGGFRSDGMLSKNGRLIAVEIESGQAHPDTNVAKYWFLYEKGELKTYKRITVLHFFTPGFTRYPGRLNLASFLQNKVSKQTPIKYLTYDFRALKSQREVLRKIKCAVTQRVESEFRHKRELGRHHVSACQPLG